MIRCRELDDRKSFIVDDLVRPEVVQFLYDAMATLPFQRSEYNNEATSHIKYFNHNFDIAQFKKHALFGFLYSPIAELTNQLYPGGAFTLDRIHCNNQCHGEIQTPHEDIRNGMTALFFVNPKWLSDWEGEIIFYDSKGEPFYAIAPKPGRVIVFPGDLVHRGGVPSRLCFEPRLTVAFKYRATSSRA